MQMKHFSARIAQAIGRPPPPTPANLTFLTTLTFPTKHVPYTG